MSRHHYGYHTSYTPAPVRQAPRWPWVFGLLIVATMAGAGTVLFRADLVDLAARGDVADPTATTVAVLAPPPPTVAPSPIPSAPAATTIPVEDVVAQALPTDEALPPTANPAPAPTAVPTKPAATPEPRQALVEVVQAYLDRWSAGDYDGLYDLISPDAQAGVTRQDFIGRYEAIATEAELTEIRATVDGEPNLQTEVPIRVEMQSSAVGTITEANRVPLVKVDGDWKVAWTPSLIFAKLGADGCVDLQAEFAERGRILDRNGEVLAFDGPISRVGVVPGRIADERLVLRELAKLTGYTEDEIKARYAEQNPEWFIPIKDFPQEREQELLNVVSPLEGVGVQSSTSRVYPLGAVAAHVTGYVSQATVEQVEQDPNLAPGTMIGQAGVEAGADDLLTGAPGGRLVIVQCESRAERQLIGERKPIPAKDVVLTIDITLQRTVDEAMTAQGKDLKGAVVVLDPRDGSVLAMVSHPTFDPNGFVLGFSDADAKKLNDEKTKPLLNRATQAAYPTGSIFKVITTAAAMADLGYTAETGIDCPSTFGLEGSNQIWEDWTVAAGMGPQGWLSLHQALVNSCNTVFYQLGRDLDLKDDALLPDMAKAFGLGAPTDIPYLPEVGGTVPDPKWKLDTYGDYWATGDAVNLAIGQGFLEATPLQMAVAYAAVANGGDVLQPFIVSETTVPNGATTKEGERVVRNELPVPDSRIREIQAALRDQPSNTNGYGSWGVFGDFPWPIAGKTGTAENELDRSGKPHSWFAAFGPYGEDATITSTVMFETVGEGVSYAAPVTRRIYEAYLDSDLVP